MVRVDVRVRVNASLRFIVRVWVRGKNPNPNSFRVTPFSSDSRPS